MKNVILKKENGNVELITKTSESDEKIKQIKITHLCWENCKYAYANKCPKVANVCKKNISEYEFITEGFQSFNDEGENDIFAVTKCENYEKVENKKLSASEKERLKKLKEGIRMAYFDANNIEEAYRIQKELKERGHITNIKGKNPEELLKDKKIRK